MHKAQRESWPYKVANWMGMLGAIDYEFSVTNVDELTYYASLDMGSGPAGVNVVFDTGNLGLAVQGSSCVTDCAAAVYDETSSTNYSPGSTAWTHTYKTA